VKSSWRLDPPSDVRPSSPEFGRFMRLDALVRGGEELFRDLFHEEPATDLISEADAIRAHLTQLMAP